MCPSYSKPIETSGRRFGNGVRRGRGAAASSDVAHRANPLCGPQYQVPSCPLSTATPNPKLAGAPQAAHVWTSGVPDGSTTSGCVGARMCGNFCAGVNRSPFMAAAAGRCRRAGCRHRPGRAAASANAPPWCAGKPPSSHTVTVAKLRAESWASCTCSIVTASNARSPRWNAVGAGAHGWPPSTAPKVRPIHRSSEASQSPANQGARGFPGLFFRMHPQ